MARRIERLEGLLNRLLDHEFIKGIMDGELALRFPVRITGPTGTPYWIVREVTTGHLKTVAAPGAASDWSDA